MVEAAGIKDTNVPLLIVSINTPICFFAACAGALYTETWGRRKQMGVCAIILGILFIVMTSLSGTNVTLDSTGTLQAKNSAQAIAVITITQLFGIVFSIGYKPLQVLYPVEVLRFETRSKGMEMYGFFGALVGFYNTFVTSIAFTAINWRYYFIFIFWNFAAAAFIYYFYVETKKRMVEELTEIFRSQYPVKTSCAKSSIIIHGDETIVHDDDKVY